MVTYIGMGGGALLFLLLINGLVDSWLDRGAPIYHEDLNELTVYAYRDWQSTGLQLHSGDSLEIQATGRWLYTPDEFHGPAGHPRYPAPSFYPVSRGTGGSLIGRIGESGSPFLIGRRINTVAHQNGLLYLRINDDILSDNRGSVVVEISVTPSEQTSR